MAARCLDESTLGGFVAGELDPAALESVERHLDSCVSCFDVLVELSRDAPERAPEAMIDEYRLLRLLGRGAMGQVYLARDTRLDRLVAIKMVGDTAQCERFFIEARALARVADPNVVAIYRVGELAERPYLVYEFVPGRSLAALDRPVPWRRARELALGLARGLAAAHRAGVLHRDIKPANAVLAGDGTVKILDFGLAKVGAPVDLEDLDEEDPRRPAQPASLTHDGALLGTPLYMAPELWERAPATVRTDLYALGAVVFELCAGRTLLTGDTLLELRASARCGLAPRLADVVDDIDPLFAAVIDRCVARDPDERWASADELVAALESRPSRARPRVFIGLAAASAVAAVTYAVFPGAVPETGAFARRSGDVGLVVQVSGAGREHVDGVALGPDGDLYVVGTATTDLDLGGMHLAPHVGTRFGFVARLDHGGRPRWVRTLASTSEVWLTAIALDGRGAAVVAGHHTGVATWNPAALREEPDCFVASLDVVDGATRWSRACGASGARARNLVASSSGALHVGGELRGGAVFGLSQHDAAASPEARMPFVATLSSAGEPRWLWIRTGSTWATTKALATYRDDIIVGGSTNDGGDIDGFVARLDAGGAPQWIRRIAGRGPSEILAVAVAPDGGTIAAGGFYAGVLELDRDRRTSIGRDGLVALLDARTGEIVRAMTTSGPNEDLVRALAFRGDGGIVAAGRFYQRIDAGSLSLANGGKRGAYLLGLDAAARPTWLRGFDGGGEHTPSDLAISGDTVAVTGWFNERLEIDGVPLAASGTGDGWLARFDLAR